MARMESLLGTAAGISYIGALPCDPQQMGIQLLVQRNLEPFFLKYLGTKDLSPDPCTEWIVPQLRQGFSADRRQICDDRIWYRCEHFNEIMRPSNLNHYIMSIVALPAEGCFSGISFTRGVNDDPFNGRHLKMLALLHGELEELWRRSPLRIEPQWLRELSPQLRKVFDALLQGLSEKQVATKMGLRAATVHNHVGRLYQKLGVNSRAELLVKMPSQRSFRPRLLPMKTINAGD